MLADGGNELQWGEYLEIFLVLSMTHLRAVHHCCCLLDILDLGVRKCVSDNILRQVFYPFLILRFNPHLIMNVKTGVVTPLHDHRNKCVIDQPFFLHHPHDIEIPTFQKQAVCY